jgi:galacturan 1,4-alpha-galacturonidase
VNAVRFEGPCKGSVGVVIGGFLKAPADPSKFPTDSWINFRYVNRLTVGGGGTLDAQGQVAWGLNDCSKNSNCPRLPTVSFCFFFFNFFLIHFNYSFKVYKYPFSFWHLMFKTLQTIYIGSFFLSIWIKI